MIRPALAAVAALTLALGLGGCITLFQKEKPAQLYRFDVSLPPAPASSGAPFTVRLGSVAFDHASSGERLVTVNGDEVAYVEGARWVAPADDLFREAVANAFETAGGRARIVPPGPARAEYRLALQVSRFEADYRDGPAAAPTIVVRLHATLERQSDMSVIGEKAFDATVRASANRVGAIVAAYDAASAQAVGGLTAWVNQSGGG